MDISIDTQELTDLKERVAKLPPESVEENLVLRDRISQLEAHLDNATTAWEHVTFSRHEERPYTLDYVERLFEKYRPYHGDRKYGDDPALVGGTALFEGNPVMIIGQQKGRNTKDRVYRNYGMSKPEGYRKALRLMLLAEKFKRPVLTFIDTPGAYPGIGAEERGQAEAIAHNLRTMAGLKVPLIATVLGEGGSGGALGIGLGNRILMLEHSIYSVISPESCSAILWKDQDHAKEASHSLKLTAQDLLSFQVVDEIVPEPTGGAHTDWDQAAILLKKALKRHLSSLLGLSCEELVRARYEKFRSLGKFLE